MARKLDTKTIDIQKLCVVQKLNTWSDRALKQMALFGIFPFVDVHGATKNHIYSEYFLRYTFEIPRSLVTLYQSSAWSGLYQSGPVWPGPVV